MTVVYSATASGGDLIDASTINNGNINVTGPSGTLSVIGVAISPSTGDAATLTATYTVEAPNGAFSPTDSGTYTIAAGIPGSRYWTAMPLPRLPAPLRPRSA